MGCCQYFAATEGGADNFTVQMPKLTFGRGALDEVGLRAKVRGLGRVALMTDNYLAKSEYLSRVRESLNAHGVEFAEFTEVQVEPTDRSVLAAARFVSEGEFDGLVSVGGGSVMDSAKGALVYSKYPADFTTYFAPPVGDGVPVPGAVLPHLACPTTGGTGSEATGLSVIGIESLSTKFVMHSPYILPDEAIVDPVCAQTLPATVVASCGFDLMSHAIECYTAKAYTQWEKVEDPGRRVMIQGANPWSDLHAREALRLAGNFLPRAVSDASDDEARGKLMWAATLAGMAFGNCGTHLPHAFSYAVSNLVRDYREKDYPPGDGPFVPHGISVIVNSPSVFRFTARAAPERHLEAAEALGADTRGAVPGDAGEVVAGRIIELMRQTGVPNGLGGLGFSDADANALAESASRQRRAFGNAPRETSTEDAASIFRGAVSYW